MPEICQTVLYGCSPEPLMNYLKALGVLRLVAEQADSDVRAAWRGGGFSLKSRLGCDGLLDFFLNRYEPTPIVAPWAGGSGFFGKDNRSAVTAILESNQDRLSRYQHVITAVRSILDEEEVHDKPTPEQKERLLRRYRRELPDGFVQWMDTAVVLEQEGQGYPPILGTGGNDGRLDFTQNFMQRLVELQLHEGGLPDLSQRWLRNALLDEPTNELHSAAVGQFAPGRAGGPNMTQGMEGSSTDNPWDFVLMIEGSLALAGSAVRRLGTANDDRSAFPFMVRSASVGYASESDKELADSRGELWLPLWDQFATIQELRLLFSEGRAEIGTGRARTGVDFARAIASLGVDRGIRSFVRIGFLKRSGKAFLAAPLGHFEVRATPSVDLLNEVDVWLDRLRRAIGDKAPPRFNAVLHAIDAAVFDYCRYGGNARFAEILQALGAAERELGGAERFRDAKFLRPLHGLSSQWIGASADNSVEFELALALSGIRDGEAKIGPLRSNLEPTDWKRFHRAWAEKERCVVWNSADLPTNLTSVLRRRIMDGARHGCDNLPLQSTRYASLAAVSAFLAGDVDDRRVESLLWGMVLLAADHRQPDVVRAAGDPPCLPRAYALLKLLFLPQPLPLLGGDVRICPEAEILPALARGDIGRACQLAMRRLRAHGIEPLPHRASGGNPRDDEWRDAAPGTDPRRLAAVLIVPISASSVRRLLQLVTRKPSAPETETLTQPGD